LKITGITAEYNPLHCGHQYHIRKSRECGQIGAIIALISANFTQRGEPSIVDKFARALSAISCGADLAVELPAVFSCRNAGIFADASVDTFAATGLVDCLSFGAEASADKKNFFEHLADILNDEPDEFKESLKKFLDDGYSFVQSRSLALDSMAPGALELLKSPNNNLPLDYIKSIR
jgi:predicted nucleotidyltransferase